MGLHTIDYVVMVIFLSSSVAIGIYHAMTGGRQRTTAEFIMANREQSVLPTVISLVVSYMSALLIIGSTAEVYTHGIQIAVVAGGAYGLSMFIAERLAVPWLYPLKLVSVFEYLELRFHSKTVRILGSVIGVAWGVLYMGSAIYAPSIALEVATGFPMQASIPLMSVVCTLYTSLGGMKAVIWTDVFQFLVMMAGMAAVMIKGSLMVGGLSEAYDICDANGRITWHSWDPNPTVRVTSWCVIGMTMNVVYQYGFQQASFQRFTATMCIRDSRLILLLTIPFVCLMFFLSYSTGIFVFAHYSNMQCDPLASGIVSNPNEILGLFVNEAFVKNVGFMGFFLATLYSGALSSVSSSLSGAAANTWEDMLKWKLSHFTDYQATLVNKALVVLYGVVGAGIAYMASSMPGPVTEICDAFLGAAGGPLFGMFLLGGSFKTSEWIVRLRGTTIGGCVSFVISLWICVMGSLSHRHAAPLPPVPINGCSVFNMSTTTLSYQAEQTTFTPANFSLTLDTSAEAPLSGVQYLYALSFFWYAPIGIILCMGIGLPISAIVNRIKRSPEVPDYLMIEWKQLLLWTCDVTKLRTNPPKDFRTACYKIPQLNCDSTKVSEENMQMLEENGNIPALKENL